MENLDIIQKAINVEVKNKYINIRGKKEYFSDFMKSHIKKIMKLSASPEKWKAIFKCFNLYSTSSMPDRKKYIELFVKVMKLELREGSEIRNNAADGKIPEKAYKGSFNVRFKNPDLHKRAAVYAYTSSDRLSQIYHGPADPAL